MKYSFESRKATQDFIPLNIDAWRIFVIFFSEPLSPHISIPTKNSTLYELNHQLRDGWRFAIPGS